MSQLTCLEQTATAHGETPFNYGSTWLELFLGWCENSCSIIALGMSEAGELSEDNAEERRALWGDPECGSMLRAANHFEILWPLPCDARHETRMVSQRLASPFQRL